MVPGSLGIIYYWLDAGVGHIMLTTCANSLRQRMVKELTYGITAPAASDLPLYAQRLRAATGGD
jgi:hypothetical protein